MHETVAQKRRSNFRTESSSAVQNCRPSSSSSPPPPAPPLLLPPPLLPRGDDAALPPDGLGDVNAAGAPPDFIPPGSLCTMYSLYHHAANETDDSQLVTALWMMRTQCNNACYGTTSNCFYL
jgi:hypothetical protein